MSLSDAYLSLMIEITTNMKPETSKNTCSNIRYDIPKRVYILIRV